MKFERSESACLADVLAGLEQARDGILHAAANMSQLEFTASCAGFQAEEKAPSDLERSLLHLTADMLHSIHLQLCSGAPLDQSLSAVRKIVARQEAAGTKEGE